MSTDRRIVASLKLCVAHAVAQVTIAPVVLINNVGEQHNEERGGAAADTPRMWKRNAR